MNNSIQSGCGERETTIPYATGESGERGDYYSLDYRGEWRAGRLLFLTLQGRVESGETTIPYATGGSGETTIPYAIRESGEFILNAVGESGKST